jgi:hypothetical protein
VLFVRTCRGKPQRSDWTVRLKTRKSNGGLGLRIDTSELIWDTSRLLEKKTEEFQIRKFTTKYYRTMLVLVFSQLKIDAV